MIDAFVAKVESGSGLAWKVTPQIINDDGNQHPVIDVTVKTGITPKVGDIVLVMTMKNNIDFSNVNKFMNASYSNGVIIGIATSQDGKYYFTGDYNFQGSFVIDGDLTIDNTNGSGNGIFKGTLEVKGNTRSLVTHAELQSWINTTMSGLKSAIDIGLNAAGIPPNPAAAGLFDAEFALISTDISSAKTDNIRTGPG